MYKKENVLIGRAKILNDSLQIYKNIIIPLQNEIRALKYHKIYMDKTSTNNSKGKQKTMPIFHFCPSKFDIENTVVQNNDFEVEMFEK